jgi:hypothetical protein
MEPLERSPLIEITPTHNARKEQNMVVYKKELSIPIMMSTSPGGNRLAASDNMIELPAA